MDQKTLKQMIQFRHELHQYPQASFNQFQTRQRIKQKLQKLGVLQSEWIELAKTALVVNLKGLAQPEGEDRCIAFRADMDALQMTQKNPHLQYKSKNLQVAHMCGHDGHMTCLIAFVPLFMKHRLNIPKNKTIRLLFQPSQQGPKSGAKLMIQEGCLQGVDEVYGFHNWPTAPLGQLWCQQGPVMSQITILNIKILGTGGHGSQPQTLKVAIWEAIAFYTKFQNFLIDLQQQKPGKFVCTLPIFKSGQRCNVIADSAFISGTIRSFEQGLSKIITNKILELLEQIKSRGFKYEFDYDINAPILINTKKQAQHILRIGEKLFGKQKVSAGKLPFKASQDFAFYTKFKPGAFFFLSTSRNEPEPPMIHNASFDFNDNLIQKAAVFWLMLAQDRLQIKLNLN